MKGEFKVSKCYKANNVLEYCFLVHSGFEIF